MRVLLVVTTMLVVAGGGSASGEQLSESPTAAAAAVQPTREPTMELGNFSVSLTVKDIAASCAFYEKLGFQAIGGEQKQNWLILQNGSCIIGLFQGMFDKNMLTFNPGWDNKAQNLDSFTDVRELQRALKAQGITPQTEADEMSSGPASFVIVDPDGNPILFDQHR